MTTNTNQAALEQELKSLQSYAAEYSEQYGLLSEQLKFMEVSVGKSTEEAIAFLKDRITEMDASGKRLTESLGKLSEQMRAVEQRMQEIYASVQQ